MRRLFMPLVFSLLLRACFAVDFEPPTYVGTLQGVQLAGQDGWYFPSNSNPTGWRVFTYDPGPLYVTPHPAGGGSQYILGDRNEFPGTGFEWIRGQNDTTWDPNGEYVVSYDANHIERGSPFHGNFGSWSLQASTTTRSLVVASSLDVGTMTANITFNVFDAAGNATAGRSPGAPWSNLLLNHWYRISHTISFAENRVMETRITDLHTGTAFTESPLDYYLRGGANPGTLAMPTAYRLTLIGNAMAYDNVVVPEPNTLLVLSVPLFGLALSRRIRR